MTQRELDRFAGFLGLCARARKLTFGQEGCVALIRAKGAALALLDEDSSPNTSKRVTDACASHDTPLYRVPPGLIARATGQDGRKVAAIGRGDMANNLRALLAAETPVSVPKTIPTHYDVDHAGVRSDS